MTPTTPEQLTQREMAIARQAARIVVDEMKGREQEIAEQAAAIAIEKFYTTIGKGVINKWLIVIGAAAVGVAHGKGYLVGLFK